ncbi:unnamed protein product [Rhizophagus irregularis]|nr:unnamed protein product [Rhizophagus irregularis]
MAILNPDCLCVLFKNFSEEQYGCNLLYTCTLVNRLWENLATPYLYEDPWKYWLYQTKDEEVAKQLIDTYMLCYKYYEIKSRITANGSSREEEGDDDENHENPSKRIDIRDYTDEIDNVELPLYNYVSFARNLHVPTLYQSVKSWYISYHPDYDEDNIQPIYDWFLRIFELFVKEANIKNCTFADSIDDDSYPVTSDHLYQLVNHGNRVNLRYLNLGFFQCDSDALLKITERCNNLLTFKIPAQNCSDDALAEFIRSQKRLTKLKIRNAKNIDLTLEALGTQSETLVKLRILNSSLESCQKPFNGIASCSKLRSIYMRHINWPVDISISTLLMPIAKRCEFHNVDFSHTYLPADVLVEIAKKSSTTLRKVHLIGIENQIDHDKFNLSTGIKALADHCKSIVHFERDIIPKEIVSMIFFIDTIGKSLVRLEIESELMKESDASRLIVSISQCSKLEILNIGFFEFNQVAFEKLILGCNSLTVLSICNSNSLLKMLLNNYTPRLIWKFVYRDDDNEYEHSDGSGINQHTITCPKVYG